MPESCPDGPGTGSPYPRRPAPTPHTPTPQLTSLPAELGAVTLMESVSLFKCHLRSLPGPMLAGWRLCRRLALYENELEGVPDEIGDMDGLQEL